MTLEEILQKHFNCKKPFLKKPNAVGAWNGDEYGDVTDYEHFTKAGGRAYGKLSFLHYDLNEHRKFDVHQLIDWLDESASNDN